MHVKENIGARYITSREEDLMRLVRSRLGEIPELVFIGPMGVEKLPILSFLIKCPTTLGKGFLHHDFVCHLLNDLFGIQARSGCACAGPYVQELLGLSLEQIQIITGLLPESHSHMSKVCFYDTLKNENGHFGNNSCTTVGKRHVRQGLLPPFEARVFKALPALVFPPGRNRLCCQGIGDHIKRWLETNATIRIRSTNRELAASLGKHKREEMAEQH